MNPNTSKALRLAINIAYGVIIVLILFCIFSIVKNLIERQNTGILNVSSSDNNARLSVSQPNHEAKSIGIGSASVRLSPGYYLLASADKGQVAQSTINVYKQQTTNAKLNPSQVVFFPTVGSINFLGLSGLVNSGITAQQATSLRQYFFKFNTAAKTVNIDASSFEPGPHDPNTSTYFSANFSVTIDSVPYKAAVHYSGLFFIELFLYDQSGNQVFDSGALPTS
jgi:hypothetical protein